MPHRKVNRRSNAGPCQAMCRVVHSFAGHAHHAPPEEHESTAIAHVMTCRSGRCKCNQARNSLRTQKPHIYQKVLAAIAASSEPQLAPA